MAKYNLKYVCEGRLDYLLQKIQQTAKQTNAHMIVNEIHAEPNNNIFDCGRLCEHAKKCKYEKKSTYRSNELRGYSLNILVA